MKDLKLVFKYLKGSHGYAILSLIFALLSVLAKMAIPYVAGLAIDHISKGQTDISLDLILIGAFIIGGMIFRYLFDLFTSYLGQKLVKNMRDQVFASFNRVSLRYIDNHYHGDLVLRLVNDIENVQTGLIVGAGALYEGIVQIAVTLVFMFMLNWILALTVIVLTPLSILVSKFVSSHNSKYYKEQNAKTGTLTAYSLESITNLETAKAYGFTATKETEFDQLNESLRVSNFKSTFAVGWINPSTRLVNNIIYAVITFLGAYLILHNPGLGIADFGVGALSALLSYAYQYMSPFNEISNVASEVSYALASFKRIDSLIETHDDVDAGTVSLNEPVKTLKADHIDFSYDGKRPIIKDMNVEIYQGHKIALVGPTGCGKTTIINLLLRFYDPQNGGFVVNGKNTREYPKSELRKHIGMVLQDTWLFNGSIKDNIAYGKPEASLEEIKAAAIKAHADDFIRQLPQGYDTIVSNSSGLSTGEKQLLCVARIMLIEPEVVILDEATSNIDLRTELLLSKSFDELMKGKTSLVVAHRLSTIKNADLILVLKDGAVIEQGNFSELMAQNGFFKELYDSQLS
jgi:ABC-type multidrug transport system, ATPase and permease components